jgi:hypothetical protein
MLAREDEREKENGGGGVRRHLLYQRVEVGNGSAKGAMRRQGVGEGPSGAPRPADLTAVGAGERLLRARLTPNRGEARADQWSPATVPDGAIKYGLNHFKNSNYFKNIQFFSNFNQSKFDLSELQKFGIKYCFEDLKEMNNFLHRNLFRSRMDFK